MAACARDDCAGAGLVSAGAIAWPAARLSPRGSASAGERGPAGAPAQRRTVLIPGLLLVVAVLLLIPAVLLLAALALLLVIAVLLLTALALLAALALLTSWTELALGRLLGVLDLLRVLLRELLRVLL